MIILLVFHLKITFQTLGYLESYIFAFSIWVSNLLNFSKTRTFFSFCQPGLCSSDHPHFILSLPLLPESVAIFVWVYPVLFTKLAAGCQPYSLASCDLMTSLKRAAPVPQVFAIGSSAVLGLSILTFQVNFVAAESLGFN